MSFSFKTKRRWIHGSPVVCDATLNFTHTQSGRSQIQVTMTDSDGNRQFSWTSLESERAEGILSNRLRPFINSVCNLTMTPETVIDRSDLLQNLQAKNDEGKTLQELLEGHTIKMSVITNVAPRDNGETRVRVISFLTPAERGEEKAKSTASQLNQEAKQQTKEEIQDSAESF